jgi:SAM-dependent methyltransferase
MFFRKSAVEPLPVTMSAVRIGERVLQVGVDDADVAGAIAAKVGLSGNAAIAVADEREAARAHGAASKAGVLVDVKVAPLASLPFETGAFDLVVVHGTHGLVSSLDPDARHAVMREWRRVLRRGGRVMTIEAGPAAGIASFFKPHRPNESYQASGGIVGALEIAGFKPVRLLGEREGYRFAEGINS